MDHYHIWVNLREGVRDLDFADAVGAMLDAMRSDGKIETWTLARRKLGWGPEALGEWHVDIGVKDMAQLEEAFTTLTPRSGAMEKLHAAVWSKVTDFRSGLWRDFPDKNRKR